MRRSGDQRRAPGSRDRAPPARPRAAALGRAVRRRRGDDGGGLRGTGHSGGGRARASYARGELRPGAGPGHPAVGLRAPVNAGYPEHLRQEVERYVEAMRFSGEALTAGLEEAMRYSLLAGGKRIRPVLALATARAIGLGQQEVMPLAGAIGRSQNSAPMNDHLAPLRTDE